MRHKTSHTPQQTQLAAMALRLLRFRFRTVRAEGWCGARWLSQVVASQLIMTKAVPEETFK